MIKVIISKKYETSLWNKPHYNKCFTNHYNLYISTSYDKYNNEDIIEIYIDEIEYINNGNY